ncbi:MAG: tyrosine-type recombinase/integrase [Gammaproteobacteria bacterium]|nr:tyrosine-type recombinase/integrase [Gammaproteobacteria bacterium]
MLTTYFKRQTTQATYYAGLTGPYLDSFTEWLEQRGYRPETIRDYLQATTQLGQWSQVTGYSVQSLSPETLNQFRDHLAKRGQLRFPSGPFSVRWRGAQLFFKFLQAQQLVAPVLSSSDTVPPVLVDAFEHWMQAHRGVKLSTLINYRRHLVDLLENLGHSPEQFDAIQLRHFILAYAEHHNRASIKTRLNATRAFLRFLIVTERCQPGLEAAIPPIAGWRLSTLPRYLLPEEVERVIAACDDATAIGIRNRAIILLLARLGLRAGEVAHLKVDDLDWSQGTVTVIGKSRREAKLPLPQAVGDALLQYLDAARPAIPNDHIFITAIAPWKPVAPGTITGVAAQALRRAGVEAPFFGAHVLRHSAATAWLRQGASLQLIGEVLRHRDTDTTAHYAKVDTALLQQVTRPWPGATPC